MKKQSLSQRSLCPVTLGHAFKGSSNLDPETTVLPPDSVELPVSWHKAASRGYLGNPHGLLVAFLQKSRPNPEDRRLGEWPLLLGPLLAAESVCHSLKYSKARALKGGQAFRPLCHH